MSKQTLIVELDVPDGYELTGEHGEYRAAKPHEFFLDSDNKARQAGASGHPASWPILRKVEWQAPLWIPDGCWVYRSSDGWYASLDEPVESISGGSYGARRVLFKFLCSPNFDPPQRTKKIQVRRGS